MDFVSFTSMDRIPTVVSAGGELPVEKFTFDKDTDLAIMRFQMPIIVATGEEMTHKSLQISFDGPVIGDECVGIAYTVEQSFREDSDIPTFTVEPHLHFAPGSAFHLMDPAGVSHGPCLPARISSLRCTSLKSRVSHERWPPSC